MMYKIILWINADLPYLYAFDAYDKDKILIIGDGIRRTLSDKDLILSQDQKAKIDGSTQLVFLSHGSNLGTGPTFYELEIDHINRQVDGRDVLSKILSNVSMRTDLDSGMLCHMISCYAALTAITLHTTPLDHNVLNLLPPKSTILFHGGHHVSRTSNVAKALELIKEASLSQNIKSIEDRLYMVKKMIIKAGMVSAIQHLGKIDEIDDLTTNLGVVDDAYIATVSLPKTDILFIDYYTRSAICHDVHNFISTFWQKISSIVKQKLDIALDKNIEPIDMFKYMIHAMHSGCLIPDGYLSILKIRCSAEEKNIVLESLEYVIDTIFTLVTTGVISKEQYHQIIAIELLMTMNAEIEKIKSSDRYFSKEYCQILLKHGWDIESSSSTNILLFDTERTLSKMFIHTHPKTLELLYALGEMFLPKLISGEAGESFLVTILCNPANSSNILAKWPERININSSIELKHAALAILSTYYNMEQLSAVMRHFTDINLSYDDLFILAKICHPTGLSIILSKSQMLGLDINQAVCILDNDEKEEYEKIAKYVDVRAEDIADTQENLAKFRAAGLPFPREYAIQTMTKVFVMFFDILSECAANTHIIHNVDTSILLQEFEKAYDDSPNPLSELEATLIKVLEPIYVALGNYSHDVRKTAVQCCIAKHSKPLILTLAELDNAVEILPIILKYSSDIPLSPSLFLQLTQTPHASQIMPMILDKASAWKMELSWEVFDSIKNNADLLHAIVPNKHISLDDLLHDPSHQAEVQHIIEEYHLMG